MGLSYGGSLAQLECSGLDPLRVPLFGHAHPQTRLAHQPAHLAIGDRLSGRDVPPAFRCSRKLLESPLRRDAGIPRAWSAGHGCHHALKAKTTAARSEAEVSKPCATSDFLLLACIVAGLPIRSLRFGRARRLGKAKARANLTFRAGLILSGGLISLHPLRFWAGRERLQKLAQLALAARSRPRSDASRR